MRLATTVLTLLVSAHVCFPDADPNREPDDDARSPRGTCSRGVRSSPFCACYIYPDLAYALVWNIPSIDRPLFSSYLALDSLSCSTSL